MRESLLTELACPDCGGDLALADARIAGGQIGSGSLACRECGRRFPIEHGVPNFVEAGDRKDVIQTTRGFARNWDEFNEVILDNEALNDELFRDQLGNQALAVAQRYSWQHIADQIVGVYREVAPAAFEKAAASAMTMVSPKVLVVSR